MFVYLHKRICLYVLNNLYVGIVLPWMERKKEMKYCVKKEMLYNSNVEDKLIKKVLSYIFFNTY